MREDSNRGEVVTSPRSIDHRSIDHGSFLKEASMDYRSIDYRSIEDDSRESQMAQRAIAEKLLGKFNEPKSWKFYLKCAYRLSEDTIWKLAEQASRPGIRSPNRYFVTIANKAMT